MGLRGWPFWLRGHAGHTVNVNFYPLIDLNVDEQTFKPMHRIVPTSDSASGASSFPIVLICPVASPGFKTELPL